MSQTSPIFLRSSLNLSLFTACSLSLFVACGPGPANPTASSNLIVSSSSSSSVIPSASPGDFVVTWTSNDQENYGVYAQRFTALGQRQ